MSFDKNMQLLQKQRVKKLKPTGIDLFSGAGGLSLGFEKAGFDIRYAIECDSIMDGLFQTSS